MKKLIMILLAVNAGMVSASADFYVNPMNEYPCTDNIYIATDDGDGVFFEKYSNNDGYCIGRSCFCNKLKTFDVTIHKNLINGSSIDVPLKYYADSERNITFGNQVSNIITRDNGKSVTGTVQSSDGSVTCDVKIDGGHVETNTMSKEVLHIAGSNCYIKR